MAIGRGHKGAIANIRIMADSAPVARHYFRYAKRMPEQAKEALREAVTWWHRKTITHIPVAYYRGRGQLKKRTQPFIVDTRHGTEGGIKSGVDYAIWLAAGTRHIAGGRVMRWRPGQQPISDWPAKRMGSAPRALLPIILPWHREAADRLYKGIVRRL